MQLKIRALALAGLVALPLSSALAGDIPPAGQAPSARACVEGIVDAGKKEDLERMCSYMVDPYRTAMPKILKIGKDSEAADADLVKAMEAKFGPGSDKFLGMRQKKQPKKPIEGDVEILEVKEEGEVAHVKTKETKPPKREGDKPTVEEDTITCRKQGEFWYAEPPTKGQKGQPPMDQQIAMMDKLAGVMEMSITDTKALTADISSGTVATKEDAKMRYDGLQQKMMMAVMGAMQGMQGGPGGRPGGPGGPKAPPPPAGGDKGGAKPPTDGHGEGDGHDHGSGEKKTEGEKK